MVQSFAATIINAKHVSMACAVINNGKPTGNTLFRMDNPERDFKAEYVDIREVKEGEISPDGQGVLQL